MVSSLAYRQTFPDVLEIFTLHALASEGVVLRISEESQFRKAKQKN